MSGNANKVRTQLSASENGIREQIRLKKRR